MEYKDGFDTGDLAELATELGVNYKVLLLKSSLVEKIKSICKKQGIGVRALARQVPGLYPDRVSKIFNGEIGHMTIDKLIEILDALHYTVEIKTKKSA